MHLFGGWVLRQLQKLVDQMIFWRLGYTSVHQRHVIAGSSTISHSKVQFKISIHSTITPQSTFPFQCGDLGLSIVTRI